MIFLIPFFYHLLDNHLSCWKALLMLNYIQHVWNVTLPSRPLFRGSCLFQQILHEFQQHCGQGPQWKHLWEFPNNDKVYETEAKQRGKSPSVLFYFPRYIILINATVFLSFAQCYMYRLKVV